MIRWIEGELDGSYLGEPGRKLAHGRALKPRLYRAVVRAARVVSPPTDARPPVIERPLSPAVDAEAGSVAAPPALAAPPAIAAPPATLGPAALRQARIDAVQVPGLLGDGTLYEGAFFDVRIAALTLSFPTDQQGRAYGRVTGRVLGCVVLPPEPPPERVPPTVHAPREAAPAGTLYGAQQPAEGGAISPSPEAELAALEHGAAPLEEGRAQPAPARSSWLPAASLLALVALGLGVGCGALPALLWCLFILPTVLARALFRGVIRESVGVRVAGAVLAALSLACAALVAQRWAGDCKEGALLPVLVVIAALFPAGLLPSRGPLTACAASLAVVLVSYCRGPAGACASARAHSLSAVPTGSVS